MGEDEVGEGDLSLETVTHTHTHTKTSPTVSTLKARLRNKVSPHVTGKLLRPLG